MTIVNGIRESRASRRRKIDENGVEVIYSYKPSVLTADDNITNIR